MQSRGEKRGGGDALTSVVSGRTTLGRGSPPERLPTQNAPAVCRDSTSRINEECVVLKTGYNIAIILPFMIAGVLFLAVFAGQKNSPSESLVRAARSGSMDMVGQDLDRGASVNSVDREGNTALNRAALMGHEDLSELLLKRGADVNSRSKFGKTALMAAASKGRLPIVALLINNHADVNAMDDYGQTALMCASLRGHSRIVNLLLDRGADVNVRTRRGFTALSLASDQGHRDIVEAILQRKPLLTICGDRQDRHSKYR